MPRLQRDRRRQAGENAYGERGSLLTGGTQATFYESIAHEAATDVDCHRSEVRAVRNAGCLTLLGLLPEAEMPRNILTS